MGQGAGVKGQESKKHKVHRLRLAGFGMTPQGKILPTKELPNQSPIVYFRKSHRFVDFASADKGVRGTYKRRFPANLANS
jgi:hypothetical protein